ncbi:CDP-glucose 4,6-dehydratase [Parasedimentitalea maritima]|uniref:CDP-glucose 4,6-dehydratase n=2 Tax=Parasedimentitalea maritima TaxID=2578117 RepID=A0ABY2URZ8_9RHOB|nr:CDP-glucose 4,6-dehydratase [Zongyanglinia marina]
MNWDSWAGRRVFLSGHTGFKGTWMCLALLQMGAKVTGFALDPDTTSPAGQSFYDAMGVADKITDVRGDVTDASALTDAMAKAAPEVVLHFAAQPLVRRGYAEPAATFASNLMGTVNLLEAVRACPSVGAVLVVTTDKVYRNEDWAWSYRETDNLGGLDPYSASKACAELAVASYRASILEGVQVATARAGNVIGGGDWAEDRLIPDLVRAFIADSTTQIRNPLATRPWEFVLEPLMVYLKLCDELLACTAGAADAWNVGPAREDAWPVSRIADRTCTVWGDGAAWELTQGDTPQPKESKLLTLDPSKVHDALSYTPLLHIDGALDWTVELYRAQADVGAMRDIAAKQVRAYLDASLFG